MKIDIPWEILEYRPLSSWDLVKSQKTTSTNFLPMMEYIPLENEVCPIPLKSAQDVGIPE
jgi:hypothetical protein